MTQWSSDTCKCVIEISENIILHSCNKHTTIQQALDYNHTFSLSSQDQLDKTKYDKNQKDKQNAKSKT